MAQDLVKSGVELPALMTAGRWKSAKMLARYSERQATDRGAVARYYEESGEQNCLRPSCHRLRTKLAQEPSRAEVIMAQHRIQRQILQSFSFQGRQGSSRQTRWLEKKSFKPQPLLPQPDIK